MYFYIPYVQLKEKILASHIKILIMYELHLLRPLVFDTFLLFVMIRVVNIKKILL